MSLNAEENLKRLCKWFKKRLDEEQVVMWLDRIDSIPDPALTEIVDGIIDTSKWFPTPNNIKKGWWEWRRANSEGRELQEITPCMECAGHGLIWYTHKTLEQIAHVVCARCDNWKRHFGNAEAAKHIPIATRAEIEYHGHELKDDPPTTGGIPRKRCNPKKLEERAGTLMGEV